MSAKTKKLTVMAMFAAISVVLAALIHFSIFPVASFLEYDPADIPIFIIAFAYGPVAGFCLTAVVAVIQGLTVSAQSGLYGILMHLIATGSFVLVAGNIYKAKRTRGGAAIALACGIAVWVLVMYFANLVITPLFMGVPVALVKDLMWVAIVPFNLIKAGGNAVVTFIVYKMISNLIQGRKVIEGPKRKATGGEAVR